MRRLSADHQRLMTAFAGHSYIGVTAVGPLPPERYRVIYNVTGLRLDAHNRVTRVYQHIIDVALPTGYPRDKPYCVSLAPVFHPNFGAYVCIADFWSPSQSLLDVVIQMGDMLQYKLFNTRSPLNAVAARWVAENPDQVPVGTLELLPREPEIRLRDSSPILEAIQP